MGCEITKYINIDMEKLTINYYQKSFIQELKRMAET